MKRDFDLLGKGPVDLLVIGGGIHGAWIAYDGALRGLKVCLVEKNDWASGTSCASSKLIHGGLRYLRQMQFGFVRKSLLERERLLALGPHRIRPLEFVFPVHKDRFLTRWLLGAGLLLYGLLAGPKRKALWPHRLSGIDLAKKFPSLRGDEFDHAFSFADALTDDARLTLEIVGGAISKGAVAVNHAEVVRLHREGGLITGATVRDRLKERSARVHARVTVNAAGAWAWKLLDNPKPAPYRLSKGVHLIMPALPDRTSAFVFFARKGSRVCFLIPWNDRVLLGTTDSDYRGSQDGLTVSDEDIEELLSEANSLLKGHGWNKTDVINTFAGLRVLKNVPGAPSWALTRDWSLLEPENCLLMPIGGKLTTARMESAQVVDRVFKILNKTSPGCMTGSLTFPWKPDKSFPDWLLYTTEQGKTLGLDAETAQNCAYRYGNCVSDVFQIISQAPDLAQRIVPDLAFCWAEIVHAARNEMACTLADVFRRRIPLAILARLPLPVVEKAASLLTPLLEWSPQRMKEEIDDFLGRPQ